MIIDKPSWVTHGSNIFSVDVHPSGSRFATAAADNRVKIWNMLPVVDVKHELDPTTPRLLATLADHYSAVNVARFSRSGRFIASGADDKLVCVYELRSGPGGRTFGSSDVANVENWKHVMTLKGHTNNVLDLAWAPEDQWVATCSVDNLIVIWDGVTGAKVATLEGHTSYVRALVWDPVGSYLASQSDDKSVRIWRAGGDWAQLGSITECFKRWVSLTFSLRIDWAPDGGAVVGVNSFRSPQHTAVLLDRGCWETRSTERPNKPEFTSLVGHTAAVLVARYSPRMFRTEGGLKACLALGSQDKRLTVWLGASRPVYIGRGFFRAGIVDLAWASDGLTLIAASTDGTVALLHFAEEDLGPTASQEEMDAHMRAVYGDTRARTTVFAESAAQLDLEEEAEETDAAANGRPSAALHARMGGNEAEAVLGSAVAVPKLPKSKDMAPAKRRLEVQSVNGTSKEHQMGGPPAKRSRPPLQQPARQPQSSTPLSGHPLHQQPKAAAPSRAVPTAASARPGSAKSPLPKASPTMSQPGPKASGLQPTGKQNLSKLPVGTSKGASSALPQNPGAAGQPPPRLLIPSAVPLISIPLGAETNIIAGQTEQREVQIANVRIGGSGSGSPATRISAAEGGRRLWDEELPGTTLIAAGSLCFVALAFADKSLQIFTAAGRRMLPTLQLGESPAFLAASEWRLLAVAADGGLWLWDLQWVPAVVLRASAAPLLALLPTRVLTMQLSAAGLPLAAMSDGSAHVWHDGMEAWLRVADGSFRASPFQSSLQQPSGELAQLQAAAGAGSSATRRPAVMATLCSSKAAESSTGRGHLEANMAAALALQSPSEYKRWLLTYVRHLSGAADDARLRELCTELLGPLHQPVSHSPADHDSSVPGGTAGPRSSLAISSHVQPGWQPQVLGLCKRTLLRTEVLRTIGRNRANQRLMTEFTDLLSQLTQ